jgi:hypothetical protein
LDPIGFVYGAVLDNVFPFWALTGLCFLHNRPNVLVIQFCSKSGCYFSHNSLYVLEVHLHLDFVAVSALFLAWSLGKGIGIVVFSALPVFRSEVVLLQVLNPACGLSFEVLKST